MLIEFTVGNYKSFKEPVTLSLVAANLKAKDEQLDANTVFEVDDELQLLTSAAIYGANASGKSNLIAALRFMQRFVLTSSREGQITDQIDVERFRLSTATEAEPCFFEIGFVLEERTYRYGFEVTSERVVREWLFHVPTVREARLFEREGDEITVSKAFQEGRGITERTRPNALFLSVAAQFNGPIATRILGWFSTLNVHLGVDDHIDLLSAIRRFEGNPHKNDIIQLIKTLDLGIDDIRVEAIGTKELPVTGGPEEYLTAVASLNNLMKKVEWEDMVVYTLHRKFDAEGHEVGYTVLNMERDESAGTQKLFGLAEPLLRALQTGTVVVIDELDARLHPLLTSAVIDLFNDSRTNPHHAQLVFTTHDTNLLSNQRFRRDQLWFVEKNRQGASTLYSLAEFKVRNDASFQRDYIQGKYGAIPFFGDFNHLIAEADAA